MKKALSILLAMGMTVGMVAGCGDTADNSSAADNSAAASTEAGTDGTQAAASAADIKVGDKNKKKQLDKVLKEYETYVDRMIEEEWLGSDEDGWEDEELPFD